VARLRYSEGVPSRSHFAPATPAVAFQVAIALRATGSFTASRKRNIRYGTSPGSTIRRQARICSRRVCWRGSSSGSTPWRSGADPQKAADYEKKSQRVLETMAERLAGIRSHFGIDDLEGAGQSGRPHASGLTSRGCWHIRPAPLYSLGDRRRRYDYRTVNIPARHVLPRGSMCSRRAGCILDSANGFAGGSILVPRNRLGQLVVGSMRM